MSKGVEISGVPSGAAYNNVSTFRSKISNTVNDFLIKENLSGIDLRIKSGDRKGVEISGVPSVASHSNASLFRNNLSKTVSDFLVKENLSGIDLHIEAGDRKGEKITRKSEKKDKPPEKKDEVLIEDRANKYKSQAPLYTFQQLIVPESVKNRLLDIINIIRLEKTIFDAWGLRELEPNPRSVLNLHGLPGTGKTLAAHALADYSGKRIIVSNYADIEDKFVGESPKNVDALFYAAKRENALLFIDEADILLSKRLARVTQAADQSMNEIRSQLLVRIEEFNGILVFATNLVESYDIAFDSRIHNVYFPMPDEDCRYRLWRRHIPKKLPLDNEVSLNTLAAQYTNICGRDIKNAVISAAVRAASEGRESVNEKDLREGIEGVISNRIESGSPGRG